MKQSKPKAKKVKAKKKVSKKDKLDKSITESYISIEDNPKYLNLSDINQTLQENVEKLK